MDGELLGTVLRLTLALAAGGMVGLERSYHGRTAGFREHTLVCISSCMLMLLADYPAVHVASIHREVFIDPTRMAQGIMTGIGFLGAGAIIKDGLAIRGLTTAASVWMISAIGIMIGMGYYLAAGAATFATLNINYFFRLIERRLHLEFYAQLHVRFNRGQALAESNLRTILTEHECEPSGISYSLAGEGRWFDYHMQLKTHDKEQLHKLADKLATLSSVCEFSIAPRAE
jgi:putative Mg2+ transporter-C (MgtC) family protein